ncbi:MAG: hydantoinase/carbamoylase family amidase, partial [Alphaproteobacteria bacterium]|nr:hydantoinase/carbamoylase family amidase [Alphaproteobacteria bacterium]
GRPFAAYFEAHIEQGPFLEAENKTIGVVTGGQGKRSFEITVTGREAHAGTTPMPARRDALMGAVGMIKEVEALALAKAPDGVGTVGMIEAKPNSRNTIPGSAFFSADLRHPDPAALDEMAAGLKQSCTRIAEARGLTYDIAEVTHYPATKFDEACVSAVRAAAERLGYSHRDIISRAGHDACSMAHIAPAGMIFVPCENGISHAEIENATPDDLAAGCNVLLHAMLQIDGS